eukprot:SAG31_NODE_283_length_18512_cov_19.352414_13_plen_67_part_00
MGYKALEDALGLWAPSTIGLEPKRREGKATTWVRGGAWWRVRDHSGSTRMAQHVAQIGLLCLFFFF